MSAQTPGEPRKDIATRIQDLGDNARAKKRDELAARHAAGQLALWPESERGIPNELVRCAVFSAKNRKERRDMYRANAPLVVPVRPIIPCHCSYRQRTESGMPPFVILTADQTRRGRRPVGAQRSSIASSLSCSHSRQENGCAHQNLAPGIFATLVSWPSLV
jgi:hypothetical protein